ncbi:hypothetical protein ACOMHN_028816 [Nucella lapillus]
MWLFPVVLLCFLLTSVAPKDLVCLVQFEFVEAYRGIGWKKKYHSPSDFCFALKHPQIQKKTSKYIRYFCAESDCALDQWIMGIRIAKLGKELLHNFEHVHHEISTWDLSQSSATCVVDTSTTASISSIIGSAPTATPPLHPSQERGEQPLSVNPCPLPDSGQGLLHGSSPQHAFTTSPAGPQGLCEGVGGQLPPGHQRKGSEGNSRLQ